MKIADIIGHSIKYAVVHSKYGCSIYDNDINMEHDWGWYYPAGTWICKNISELPEYIKKTILELKQFEGNEKVKCMDICNALQDTMTLYIPLYS